MSKKDKKEPKAEKKSKKKKKDPIVEEVVIEEEETIEGGSWTEDFEVAGNQLFEFIQQVIHETTVRRITVRNSDGRIVFDIPAAVGIAAVFPPVLMYSLVALGFAVLSDYTVSIERTAPEGDETTAEK